jgi:hypothetical protein
VVCRHRSRCSLGLPVRKGEQAAQLLVVVVAHVQRRFASRVEMNGEHVSKLCVLLLSDERDVVEVADT